MIDDHPISHPSSKIGLHISKALLFCVVLFSLCFSPLDASYEVKIEGVECEEMQKLILSVSELEKLKESSPPTSIGLKRRAEGDLTTIIQALHSQGHYDAKVDFSIENDRSLVAIKVQPGPVYPFAQFNIRYLQNGEEAPNDSLSCPITLEDLKIEIGAPALPESILSAEDTLLDQLNLEGYAFATIEKREVFADQRTKTIIVSIVVELGPLSRFGPVEIKGLERVHENFFFKKFRWEEGELYDPKKIEKTQEALELSGLFRSVNITLADQPVEGNLIPIEISVIEGKQRTIGFGIGFTTQLGPGITAEWEDRNIRGEGERLSVRTDLWVDLQNASITYLIPDFARQDQNLVWLLDYHHERNKSFIETALSLSAIIERKLTERLRFSYGGMYKILHSQRSTRNGTFDLVKAPLQLRWSNADSLLDPTQGSILQLKVTPSVQIFNPQFTYCINTLTASHYQSLTTNKRFIFASKLMLGSIIGASKHDIPPPERFYAGSENTLRGYHYMTVSPLEKHYDKPLGGRSLFIYSLELRSRFGEDFGLVLFYDIGNVYKYAYPEFNKGLLQSTGFGLRYYTPIGPLRLDFAFPLNKRYIEKFESNPYDYSRVRTHKHYIDKGLEVYFSIGQSF